MTKQDTSLPIVGWREWLSLPDLGIQHIKVKVDTGARTSALHAFYVEPIQHNGEEWVRFGIHPLQKNSEFVVECEKPVKDRRVVTDSGGHRETRYVIETALMLGEHRWRAELTLTDRDSMKFRMLMGRTALDGRFLVNPNASYNIGHKPKKHRQKRPKRS
jgi:hypothetical protein